MMTSTGLRLSTLGALDLRCDDAQELAAVLVQPKRAALLVYLALARPPGFHRRDYLLTLFWPELDQERARRALRQAVHFLRRRLGEGVILVRGDEELGLDETRLWCDARAFEHALEEARASDALELYRGDLLEGFHVAGAAPEWEHWLERERTRLRERAAGTAQRLADEEAEAHPFRALAWARRAMALAPEDEGALRRLMSLLAAAGEWAGAVKAYESFARRLAEEYELEPSAETRRLLRTVRLPETIAATADGSSGAMLQAGPAQSPPAAQSVPRVDLPFPGSPLLGRERELQAATALLLKGEARLLTLTGPGGTGKTRLSIEIARDVAGEVPDGVLFVPLAAIRDSALVLSSIVYAMGARESAHRSAFQTVANYVGDRQMLLVLDNFEQVVAGAPSLDDLLVACPGLRLLVTSRSPLGSAAEHEFAVSPLALPEGRWAARAPRRGGRRGLRAWQAFYRYPAVELFVQRAQAVSPPFRLDDDNVDAVVEICRRLDGLPLAIELAAARSRVLPVPSWERLVRRLPMLTSRDPEVTPRHQTMRHAIAWSYDLLPLPQQRLFLRLSVFHGGFTLEAAESVCHDQGGAALDVAAGLESLLDCSLLRERTEISGEARLEMLETTREFAAEVLEESGEADALSRRHAEYFHDFVVRADPAYFGPAPYEACERMAREHDNLRAAHDWLIQRGEEKSALRMACAMWVFWQVRGFREDGRRRMAAALALRGSSPVSVERAGTMYGMGVLAYYQGDYAEARELQKESVAMWNALGHRQGLAYALSNLSSAAMMLRDYATARRLLEESLALFREVEDRNGVAMSLTKLGSLATEGCEYAAGRAFLEESLLEWRRLGESWGIAKVRQWLACVDLGSGDYQAARAGCRESLAISREAGDLDGIGYALQTLGRIELEAGDVVRARELLEEALALQRRIDDRRGQALCIQALATCTIGTDPEAGRELAERSLEAFRGVEDVHGSAGSLRVLGVIAASAGETTRASALYRQSLQTPSELEDPRGVAECFEGMSAIAANEDRLERAAVLLSVAGAIREEIGSPLPRSRQQDQAYLMDRLRRGLSEPTFALAWANGSALRDQAAIAFALDETAGAHARPVGISGA